MSERFAFKIDKALKLNLYKICRLCGIDNPDKVHILSADASEVVNADGEPVLRQKIKQLIGLNVAKDDKMPQTMCTLCVEKINDFYEFREMCYATDAQTRKLLGLKPEVPKKAPVEIKPEPEVPDVSTGKRGRKRKSDETVVPRVEIKEDVDAVVAPVVNSAAVRKKLRLAETLPVAPTKKLKDIKLKPLEEIKDEPVEVPTVSAAVAAKLKQVCSICTQRFSTKGKLERHRAAQHVPHVPRYICIACDETLRKGTEIKNHQLWHKLSKTPYVCPRCGESIATIYAYTRHLRDHTLDLTTIAVQVMDRTCTECREKFVTNFLFNIHPCAVRTHKCAGCNRTLRNDTEYVRHTTICSKAYLQASVKLIEVPVATEEASDCCVRIKNENDVEAAAAAEALARNAGISLDLTPVVSLTRLPSPLVMAANQCVVIPAQSLSETTDGGCKTTKKGNKKGVSKKELKRVDELLKSTLDALVSIKHEPEVHVESDVPLAQAEVAPVGGEELQKPDQADEVDDAAAAFDDFHHGDNDDDDDDGDSGVVNMPVATELGADLNTASFAVKQEVPDESYGDACNTVGHIQIKQELVDTEYAEAATAAAGKMPVLRIKIRKEHGTLNSSLVDEASARNEKKKKKKKRKEAERKEKLDKNQNSQESSALDEAAGEGALCMPQSDLVHIKQEPLVDDYIATDHQQDAEMEDGTAGRPEPTVMTSIPLMQFQIACIASGVEFGAEAAAQELAPASVQAHSPDMQWTSEHDDAQQQQRDEEPELDVKPNREELDRMLCISSVSSGVDMDALEACKEAAVETAEPAQHAEVATPAKMAAPHKTRATARKPKKPIAAEPVRASSGKALKSTGGVMRTARKSTSDMPQIVAVRSGVEVDMLNDTPASSGSHGYADIVIKAEPCNRGYSDELHVEQPTVTSGYTSHNMDEQHYINSIDFNNISVKQEKDMEVLEEQLTHSDISAKAVLNGVGGTCGDGTQQAHRESRRVRRAHDDADELTESYATDSSSSSSSDGEEDDDDDDEDGTAEVEEEREYRELELPPPLDTTEYDTQEQATELQVEQAKAEHESEQPQSDCRNVEMSCENMQTIQPTENTSFVIASVCSQASDELLLNSAHSGGIEAAQTAPPVCVLASSEQNELVLQIAPVTELPLAATADERPGEVHETSKCVEFLVAPAADERPGDVEVPETTKYVELPLASAADGRSGDVDAHDASKSAATISGGTEFPLLGSPLSISGQISATKEASLEAQPFFEARTTTAAAEDTSVSESEEEVVDGAVVDAAVEADDIRITELAIDEEQQNVLNQEMLEQITSPAELAPATNLQQLHPYLEDITSSSGSSFSCASASTTAAAAVSAMTVETNKEETENLINESADAALRRQQLPQASHFLVRNAAGSSGVAAALHPLLLDNSSINEIAENNNNANIERELQDDNAAARLDGQPPPFRGGSSGDVV